MNRGGSALARRLYLHMHNCGPIQLEDMARLVEIIEKLEEKVSDSEALFQKILADTDHLGFTPSSTLNQIQELLTKLEK